MIETQIDQHESSICSTGPSPLIVVGYLRRLIAFHFSNPNYIQDENLRSFIWKPDKTIDPVTGAITTNDVLASKISIEMSTNYLPNTAHQRPAIVVKRNTINTKRLGIGDELHGSVNLLGDVDPNEYATVSDIQTMFQIEGSCTLLCLGVQDATTEALGYEVFRTLLAYAPVIRHELSLYDFQVPALEGIAKLEEDKEIFVTSINASYSYVMGSILRYEAPLLKGFLVENTGE